MSTVALTTPQQLVLSVLTDEPRRGVEIGREVGLKATSTNDALMRLCAKGLARKHLNPTRWSRT